MAITVNIYYTGENGNAKKFAEEMASSGIVRDIRAEEGNIRYDFWCPTLQNHNMRTCGKK